ncbi:MAG: hypothetical protein ACOVLE_07110, partial [Pirellula staleyi]
ASAEQQLVAAADINHWLTTAQLRAQIDRIVPLSETANAHRLQEASTIQKQGQLSGKIVLAVSSRVA